MDKAFFIGAIALVMLGVGAIAGALGVTSSTLVEIAISEPEAACEGFFCGLDALWQIFSWAFTAVSAFFQIMTFQVDIPTLANLFIMLPITFVMGFLLYQAVRQG